jgi:hypothetical protein
VPYLIFARQSYGNLKIATFVWGLYGAGCIEKSHTNNLPALTDLTENHYGKKKTFFKDETQKSASVVPRGIVIKMVPRRPIFEKCPHLREKGGVLKLKTPRGVCAYPYSRYS